MYRFGVAHLVDSGGLKDWWAATWTDYDPDRFRAFFPAADATSHVFFYNFVKVYQRAFSGEVFSGSEPFNDGFFFLERDYNGDRFYFASACQEGLPHIPVAGDYLPEPQCVRLDPEFVFGDLAPYVESAAADTTYDLLGDGTWYNGRFLTPFCVIEEPDGGWHYATGGSGGSLIVEFPSILPILNTGSWTMMHYQPHAWSGLPPDVISSIVARIGGGGYLDSLSFNLSSLSYTISPWGDVDYNIHVSREVGTSIADLLLEIVEHTADILCFTMGGKLSLSSKQIPLCKPTLSATDDGILKFEYKATSRYILNKVSASYGSGMLVSGVHSRLGEVEMSAGEVEDMMKSQSGKWTVSATETDSIAKYGICQHRRRTFPHLLKMAGDIPHLTRWLAQTRNPFYECSTVQDLRGAGYDVGWRINSVDVDTGIAASRRTMRCIGKKIDFNTLIISSTLFQEVLLSTDFGEAAYAGRSGGGGASRIGSAFDKGFDSDAFGNYPIFSGFSSGFSSGFGSIIASPGFDSGFSAGYGPGLLGG